MSYRMLDFSRLPLRRTLGLVMSSPRRLAPAALAASLLANLTAALAVLLPFAAGSRLQAAEIYVLTGNQSGSGNQAVGFGKIDSTTGNYTEIIANVGSGNQVSNLAWNVAASNFFVTENIGTDQNLRTLDTSGVLSASIGTIGRSLYGMAYNGPNTLYGYDYSTDKLGSERVNDFETPAERIYCRGVAPVCGRAADSRAG